MPDRPAVSLVIPMFNEEANIEHALEYAVDALSAHTRDYEIIIVDDASTDDSPQIVQRAAAGNPRVRLFRHDFNRKLGASLKTGFAAARFELILYMDADLPFDPDVLGRAIRAMNLTRADLISGYRFDRTVEGFKRSLYSAVYNAMIRFLFGSRVRDVNFSFKLMKREVLEAVDLRSEGSLIDAELVVKAKNRGFAIQQIGLDYFPRVYGDSSLSSPGVILKILRELVRLFPEMRRKVPRPGRADHTASTSTMVEGAGSSLTSSSVS
ncbi:MAG TPA: glycosyltransferase family 2 protein [Thermoanaerobaculia bacterium]|nr:glycosyltransferase family 2 protein [Thermoanaerobaculia bacterium]